MDRPNEKRRAGRDPRGTFEAIEPRFPAAIAAGGFDGGPMRSRHPAPAAAALSPSPFDEHQQEP